MNEDGVWSITFVFLGIIWGMLFNEASYYFFPTYSYTELKGLIILFIVFSTVTFLILYGYKIDKDVSEEII